MKTQIGNTTKAFGREYSMSVTNYGGDDLMKSYDMLHENTLIISSKVDNNLEDIGSYAMFMTDAEGHPVRLTYTIQPGNGLYVDPNDTDIIRMVIDENSITADDGDEIYVNKNNIIDNNTLTVNPTEGGYAKRGRIAVVTANLEKATDVKYGIVKGDEITTYIDLDTPGEIHVNTQNLDTVDDRSNRDGIVRHSSEMYRTIEAVDGKLQVLTYNLDKATSESFGVVKTDDVTIQADDNGQISVITEGLDKANQYRFGIVQGDENTVNIDNGIITVNTRNLAPANYDEAGVVKVDKYSLIVDGGGFLEVNRFNEIEAILENNNPEHAIFRDDIEDLKNRVSKLETSAQQELIEFLIPANDPETVLPMPVFDKKTNTVNHYSERKTISFTIKANCKFNINVEYKQNTNNYNQVTLINVKYKDTVNIPANQLSNTIFEPTGLTVATLNFTFAVKNYDKDDNFASINTQVIISAACVNDAAIKQTSFHIFKCWNNLAFMEDKPAIINKPEEPVLNTQSYWIYQTDSEFLKIYGNNSKTTATSNNGTTAGNFYFNTYILGTYTYYNTSTNNWSSDGPIDIITSASNMIVGYYTDSRCTQTANWLSASISATYNTTKNYDILSVKSTRGLTDLSRTGYIKVAVRNRVSDKEQITGLTGSFIKLEERTLVGTLNSNANITANKNRITEIKNNVLSKFNDNYKVIEKASRNTTFVASASTTTVFKNIINSDLTELEAAYSRLSGFSSIPVNTDSEYKTFWNIVNLANKYGEKVDNDIIKFANINNGFVTRLNSLSSSSMEIIFKYEETANVVQPTINVVSSISSTGTDGIKFTLTRNAGSVVNDVNYHVDVKYNFINKNGDLVNAEGTNQRVTDYTVMLYPGNSTNYTYLQKNNDIITAATGTTSGTTTENVYYSVVTISANWVDNGSLWGIGQGHKDEGIAYYGGYNPNFTVNKTITSISDDIYLVFKLTGQDAKISNSQKYSFWSFSIKGRPSGYQEALEQANEIEFVGLSKTKYTKAKTASYSECITINNTKYITKMYGGKYGRNVQTNQCKQDGSKEKTLLNTISQEYYENNSTALIMSTQNIPVTVANNIIGIKIKSVTVSPNAFHIDPKVTYSSTGSWSSSSSSTNNSSSSSSSNTNTQANKTYTFGNAKISAISIDSWDDLEMNITFTITGGTTTNIPNNSTVFEIPQSNNGRTNFVFIQNGKSYMYTSFYNNYVSSATKWINNSCKITYRLFNDYSYNEVGLYTTKMIMYNSRKGVLETVYLKQPPMLPAQTRSQYSYEPEPYLTHFTALKFWIGLNISGVNLTVKFESALSQNGSEVNNITATYNGILTKQLSIQNAVYNNVAR